MPHKVKLEIDSVLGTIARVRLTLLDDDVGNDNIIIHDYKARVNVQGLMRMLRSLDIKRIREGTSFELVIHDSRDYERLKKGNIGPRPPWKGRIEAVEKTESARERVKRLQRELGLRF